MGTNARIKQISTDIPNNSQYIVVDVKNGVKKVVTLVINPVFAIAIIKTLTEPMVNTKFQFTPLLNSPKERISIDGMKKIIKPIIKFMQEKLTNKEYNYKVYYQASW